MCNIWGRQLRHHLHVTSEGLLEADKVPAREIAKRQHRARDDISALSLPYISPLEEVDLSAVAMTHGVIQPSKCQTGIWVANT